MAGNRFFTAQNEWRRGQRRRNFLGKVLATMMVAGLIPVIFDPLWGFFAHGAFTPIFGWPIWLAGLAVSGICFLIDRYIWI
jgi:hypothetical protein